MRQIILSGYEQNPVLQDVAVPEPTDGEVLVRIAAAALNPLDVKLQRGQVHAYFPLTFPSAMGTDLAGTIEKTGSLASRWRMGDRVMARLDPTKGGAFAEYAIVPEDQLVIGPKDLHFSNAAALPTAAGTAWQALVETADLQAGQSVLVHAGTGGVGSFAIQFARGLGARIIATASGDGVEMARELGADQVIDYRTEDFATKVSDIDVVLDTIGGETQQRSFDVLRSGGKLVSTVAPPDPALATAHKVEGAFVFHASSAKRLSDLIKAIGAKGHSALIDGVFPIASFAEAFERQASGRARGKIILSF
ncbi:NADP-dependent oxidoreductase [Agrobacterium salinitolerans]|uniref:NADP-dependent oxidoreductase n=1 Tax=Agrobacterium salinitolerans TaxID=1183413 RepID=UPI0015727325|nr:NADP-dependent oxidoreductase [Agrobacterium salinitolerans]NTA40309.1 NADP-dependent oxidoreductase [Agrobacterium salinitolerans]